jgi:outer membrane protein assembly factor BamB
MIKLLILSLALLSAHSTSAQNWPAWRGPHGNGVSTASGLPVSWSHDRPGLWRVPLPEAGNSTPVVWGNRIFLTQPVSAENRINLMCFDLGEGKLLWQSGTVVEQRERTHNTNPHGSASAVTDGERVVCWFGSAGLAAYDFEGRQLWRTDLGEHSHQFGYGGSPVIHGDLVFLNFGPGSREFLVAVDKRTGKERWRHVSGTAPADDIYGTWSTPFVGEWRGRTELISALRGELAGLDPRTGKVLWHTSGHGPQAKASPVAGEGVVVMSGDLQSSEVAVRLGGSGDITETHQLWKRTPPKRRVGTGVIHNGRYFGVQTSGIADCLDLKSGEVLWEERLTGSGANNAVWSSPLLAEGRLYIMNQSGDVFVLRAGDRFEVLAMNPLKEPTNSSVVPVHGGLLLRTHQALWRISAGKTQTQPDPSSRAQ